MPVRHEPAAPPVADEVGLQPAGQAVFAGGADESIGDQDERPIGERHVLSLPEHRVEEVHSPNWSNRVRTTRTGPQVEASRMSGIVDLDGVRSVPAEEPLELGQDLDQEVLAAEVGDRPLLDLAIVAIGLDEADILVDGAAGGPDFDGSEEHVVKYHDGRDGNQAKNWGYFTRELGILSLRYPEKPSTGSRKTPEK